MTIKNIKISNFKSFEDLDIDLNNLNIIIGSNASGKSNFVQIFKFLKDIFMYDLRNAISIQGGFEYLRNIKLPDSTFSVQLTSEIQTEDLTIHKDSVIGLRTHETTYGFEIQFTDKKHGFKILKEALKHKFKLLEYDESDNENSKLNLKEKRELGSGEIIFDRKDNKISCEILTEGDFPLKKREIIPLSLLKSIEKELEETELLIKTPLSFIPTSAIMRILDRISIYDIDPKLCKKAIPITGKADLEEDGSNLSIVLQNIVENENKKRKLFNLVNELLPFVHDLDVESFVDTSLIFKLREKYSKNKDLPASLLSDGTINVTALIVALYFEKDNLNIFEEPERNIHPHLISKINDMFKEVSEEKQLIVTTHNPEFVKNADLNNILFISRDDEGFSRVNRLDKKEEIKAFLENEIGIEELFVDNLLGV